MRTIMKKVDTVIYTRVYVNDIIFSNRDINCVLFVVITQKV